jgi:hypothetical protein
MHIDVDVLTDKWAGNDRINLTTSSSDSNLEYISCTSAQNASRYALMYFLHWGCSGLVSVTWWGQWERTRLMVAVLYAVDLCQFQMTQKDLFVVSEIWIRWTKFPYSYWVFIFFNLYYWKNLRFHAAFVRRCSCEKLRLENVCLQTILAVYEKKMNAMK